MFKNKQELLKLKHILTNRVSASVAFTAKLINDTFTVKSKGALLKLLVRLAIATGLKVTFHRTMVILSFINKCKSLARHGGIKFLVLYLKATQVLLQQSLGGMRLTDTSELKCRVSRNLRGLPRIFSPQDRLSIRQENIVIMRLCMTMVSIFRVLEFPGKLKLATITDGFKGSENSEIFRGLLDFIPTFARMLKSLAKTHKIPTLESRGISPRPIIKSGPGTGEASVSTSPMTLLLTATGLKNTGLDVHIKYLMAFHKKGTKVPYPGLPAIFEGASNVPLKLVPSLRMEVLGKLGFKEEAAGKVRVFAMCDPWTQWSLEPLHLFLFDLLAKIPMDGTFDQLKPVLAKAKTATAAYSLDLSAATDRLPISIQQVLLRELISPEYALVWAQLLVGRGYSAFSDKYNVHQVLHYAVGQPMGALSSWAMLATTHHLLVQYAAFKAGLVKVGSWYTNYAVLGDDLVIFDAEVKAQYLRIVDAIGVECGIAKSILSSKGLAIEFAKRTFYKGQDISPIPVEEFLAASYYLPDAISFARKYNLTLPQLLKVLGYGRKTIEGLTRHVGQLNSRVRALLFAYYIPIDDTEVSEMLLKGNPYLTPAKFAEVMEAFKKYIMDQYGPKVLARLKAYPSTTVVIKQQVDMVTELVLRRLHYAGFLELVANLPQSPGQAISTVVEPLILSFDWTAKELKNALKWNTKGFQINQEPLVSQVEVPSHLYEQVNRFVNDLKLIFTRLVKVVVENPMSDYREKASRLQWTIKDIKFARSPFAMYTAIIEALDAISATGSGIVHFERPLEKPLQWGVDSARMRLWRDFTRVLLIVMNNDSRMKGQ